MKANHGQYMKNFESAFKNSNDRKHDYKRHVRWTCKSKTLALAWLCDSTKHEEKNENEMNHDEPDKKYENSLHTFRPIAMSFTQKHKNQK